MSRLGAFAALRRWLAASLWGRTGPADTSCPPCVTKPAFPGVLPPTHVKPAVPRWSFPVLILLVETPCLWPVQPAGWDSRVAGAWPE